MAPFCGPYLECSPSPQRSAAVLLLLQLTWVWPKNAPWPTRRIFKIARTFFVGLLNLKHRSPGWVFPELEKAERQHSGSPFSGSELKQPAEPAFGGLVAEFFEVDVPNTRHSDSA